jgi:hypothetical protein
MRKRIARTSLRPPKDRLLAKIRATQAKGVQVAAAVAVAAAAMRTATTGKHQDAMAVLRKWM